MDPFVTAADQFKALGRVTGVRPFGHGNIHKTFLVTLDNPTEDKFILQGLNTRVFPQPERVMQNFRALTDHVLGLPDRLLSTTGRPWEVPLLLLTQEGQDHWIGPDGSFWRAIRFIDRACSFDTIQDLGHAREVGYALGFFHGLINDLPLSRLADTIEGFHITPGYLARYDQVLAVRSSRKSPEVGFCRHFITDRRPGVAVLEKAKAEGRLPLRPIHGDPKVNNVLIDRATGKAVSLVDLDTIMPGLVHYDIGDCLRSCCNPLGEDTRQWQEIRFEPELCRAILEGYLAMAGTFLSNDDYEFLFEAVRLITFELGLRFFTDYLEGNVYFKVGDDEQNLHRALVQFNLVASIDAQARTIRSLIRDLR